MSKKQMQSQAQLDELVKASHDLVAYKNVDHVPPSRGLKIQIDKKNETIILPINGDMVPFHITTIKSVGTQRTNDHHCYILVNFNFPGAPSSPHYANIFKSHGLIHLKQACFRTDDINHGSEVFQMIRTLRAQVMSRESDRTDRETLITMENLHLGAKNFKAIRLSELCVRPMLGGRGRKLTGTLEAHGNGFRYSTSRQDGHVDIMYANVKHAFFQPADKEMITLLHFHLYNHIMVGNKKTEDIQFYIEVMDVAYTFGDGKRFGNDSDEIDEGQHERDRKKRINKNFQTFVTKVNDLWGQGQFNMKFLNIEVSDSESENSKDSDQGYESSDMKFYSASEEEGDDNESMDESEDYEEEESEEEKEKTWEELKREASNSDMEKQVESDSEDERKRRNMKASGKSRVPDNRDQKGGPPNKRVKRMLVKNASNASNAHVSLSNKCSSSNGSQELVDDSYVFLGWKLYVALCIFLCLHCLFESIKSKEQ